MRKPASVKQLCEVRQELQPQGVVQRFCNQMWLYQIINGQKYGVYKIMCVLAHVVCVCVRACA